MSGFSLPRGVVAPAVRHVGGFGSVLAASAGLLLAGCIGDEFLVGGGGNDGAGGASSGSGTTDPNATSTGTDATSSSSSGAGGCGCMADGACQPGNAVDACGAAAAACQVCETNDPCRTPSCVGGACDTVPANDGDPCPFIENDETSGRCAGGVCEEAPENCLNGGDDDEDGLADCLDPDCDVGFTCVDDTPAGWTGPFAVYEGAVACPGVWGMVVDGTFGRAPDTPSYDCACMGEVTGCDVSFMFGEENVEGTCIGTADAQVVDAGECMELGASTDLGFASVADREGDADCQATMAASVEIPAPTFSEVFTVCEAPSAAVGVGCDAGACRPRAPASGGVEGDICVLIPTDDPEGATCEGDFTTKRVIGTAFLDDRGCACACTSFDCGGDDLAFHDEPTCGMCNGSAGPCAELEIGDPVGCASLSAESAHFARAPTPTFSVSDGEPNGTLQADGLVTVCCLPRK